MTGNASVLFEVDGRLFAVDAARVHSVGEATEVSAVPFAPLAVEGLVAVGGAILPLLDFAAWLDGREATRSSGKGGQIMVLDTGSGKLAARVERVLALVSDGGHGEHEVTVVAAEDIKVGAAAEGDGVAGAVGEAEEEAAAPEQRTDPFVVLGVGVERYGVPVAAVREVAPVGELLPMPGAPDALVGLTYLRGTPLAVLSLPALLGRAPTRTGVLVILAGDGGRLALLADQVLDIRRFPLQAEGSEGYVEDDGTVVQPLDPGRLVPESIRRRFRAAIGEAAAVEPVATRRLVTFTAAGASCALPVEDVERVIEYRQPVKVPPSAAGFADAIEVGGAVVPLIDVRTQLRPAEPAGPPGACLVTRLGRHAYALAIDRLERLATVPVAAIEAIAGDDGPVAGIGQVAGQPYWILSARRLVGAAGARVQ